MAWCSISDRWMRCGVSAGLLVAAAIAQARPSDLRDVLAGLVGHSKTDLIARIGQPVETITTVDGERLLYESLDAGNFSGRGGANLRADRSGDGNLSLGSYAFRCTTEVVIRDARVAAFNSRGNGCH